MDIKDIKGSAVMLYQGGGAISTEGSLDKVLHTIQNHLETSVTGFSAITIVVDNSAMVRPVTIADLPDAPVKVLTPREEAQKACDERNETDGYLTGDAVQQGLFWHVCLDRTCRYTVEFDDEPYCYTHSPNSGSSRTGYSARRDAVMTAAQAEHDASDHLDF